MAPNKFRRSRVSEPFVLGRAAMEKIMAVEGRFLSDESREMFERFDREGVSLEEQRRIILEKYGAAVRPARAKKAAKKVSAR